MSAAWKNLEGHVVNGVLPLLRCVASSDRSGLFLTESAKHASSALALKLLRTEPALANARLSRLQAAAELSHPHLIRIFEAGQCQVGELHYLYALVEYADQNLAQLLEERALAEQEVRELLTPTLSALAYLHDRKLVHGRLQPSHILAVGDQLKLASDTVCAAGESVESTKARRPYDAPEVQEGASSTAGDIWALGVTLCEALTRRQPSHLQGEHEVELPSALHPSFREIVARCLNKNPRGRPNVAELQAWLRGEHTTDEAAASQAASIVPRPVEPEPASDQPVSVESSAAQAAMAETTEPQSDSIGAAKSESDTTSKLRLVIRAEILPEGERRDPVPQRLNKRAIALGLGAIAVLALGWLGISFLGTNPTSVPAVSEEATDVESRPEPPARDATPVVSNTPAPEPATSRSEATSVNAASAETTSSEQQSAAREVRERTAATPSPINEVIPSTPQSALDTIRGTIRVAIRATIDKEGTVVAVATDDPGPSRYFERLSLAAARKWTFTPTDSEEQRMMLLRFHFTRAAVTARAEPLQ